MRCFVKPIFAVLYLALALHVMGMFIPCSGYGSNGGHWTHNKDGAVRPLVYRVLIPETIQLVKALVPEAAKAPLTDIFTGMRNSPIGQEVIFTSCKCSAYLKSSYRRLIDDAHIYSTGIKMTVIFVTLLAFVWMFTKLALAVFPDNLACALLSPVVILLWLPTIIHGYAYTYDFAELFFSCACLYLLLKRQFTAYLICFAFATLNKETSVFMFPVYVMWFYNRLDRGTFLRLLLLQIVVYCVVKGQVNIYYMDVPGRVFDPSFPKYNLRALLYLDQYHLIFLLGLLALVVFQWKRKPAFLRCALWVLPVNAIAYIAACNFGEYRSFYWSLPVLSMFIAHTLVQIGGGASRRALTSARYWWLRASGSGRA